MGKKILICDYDSCLGTHGGDLIEVLREEGYNVKLTTNKYLKTIGQENPDLVITELQSNDIQDPSQVEDYLQRLIYCSRRNLVFTAFTESTYIQLCKKLELPVIYKPKDVNVITKKVAELLASSLNSL